MKLVRQWATAVSFVPFVLGLFALALVLGMIEQRRAAKKMHEGR